MSKTENIFAPHECPWCIKEKFCNHRGYPNHNKGKCSCDETICPKIERETSEDGPAPTAKELTDEIKAFREKNKEFQATNDHEHYLIVSFSCKQDKEAFLKSTGIKTHTLVDGYELARNVKAMPTRPSFKLREPFLEKPPR